MNFNLSLFCQKYNLSEKSLVVLDGNFPKIFLQFQEQCINKAGIYGWVHKDSFKIYVGSAVDLSDRPFQHLKSYS